MTQENVLPLEDTAGDDAQPIAIELEAHDVSRFEWCDKQASSGSSTMGGAIADGWPGQKRSWRKDATLKWIPQVTSRLHVSAR